MPNIWYGLRLTRRNATHKIRVSQIFPVPAYTKPYKINNGYENEALIVFESMEAADRGREYELYAANLYSKPQEELRKLLNRDKKEIKKYAESFKLKMRSIGLTEYSYVSDKRNTLNPRNVARTHYFAILLRRKIRELKKEMRKILPGNGLGNVVYGKEEKENSD